MKFIVALFCGLMALGCLAQTRGGEYFHIPERRPAINVDPSAKWIAVGDLAHEAKFCDATSSMHCFSTKDLAFAVPKEKELPGHWKHEGQDYKIVQKLSTRGNRPAWVIEKTTGKRWWFLWSAHHGLMMFGEGPKRNQTGGYLVDGSCGFAANATCVWKE